MAVAEPIRNRDESSKMGSTISALLRTMRPHQWIKNLFVFAPLFFGGQALNPAKLGAAIAVFFAFSLMSSSIYVINDIVDRENDRHHPEKCRRPIASGALPVSMAIILGSCLCVFSLASTVLINPRVTFVLSYTWPSILFTVST